ncbi:macrophage mannose receptor 1-like [Nelusetta ayraudi]|uniref:macrophage mannose receptor 1-like n=1 Tax=Nelusetta ayraudi TaxID=303726 RepID=UPI003F70B1D9
MLHDDRMWHIDGCYKNHPFYCSSGNIIQYSEKHLSWDNASDYCQSNNMNLITVSENNTSSIKSSGWIGLKLILGKGWSWSGGMKSDYRNWADKEPALNNCVLYKEVSQLFHAKDCARKYAAVCQDDNLVIVKEKKTWEDALNHCRKIDSSCEGSPKACTYKYNLLSLQDSDYQYVRDRIYSATTDEVWTGLRFLAGSWWWMDGRKVTNNGQLPSCPSQQRHCGTLSKYDTNNWIIRDCAEKRNFVCYAL